MAERRRSPNFRHAGKPSTPPNLEALLRQQGLSEAEVDRSLAYAFAAGARTPRIAFELAMSRATLSDAQLAAGVRFTADAEADRADALRPSDL